MEGARFTTVYRTSRRDFLPSVARARCAVWA